MSQAWLYQMSAGDWPEAQYREAIWEGAPVYWPVGTVRSSDRPEPGDRVLCWYVTTGSKAPGLWGWGIVTNFFKEMDQVVWRPVFPSDYLKMNPIYDDAIQQRVDAIRGRMRQATMFPVDEADARWMADRIRTWMASGP